ncbi:hypothetical protein J2Z75_003140 [Rhizobium herbae]|uniref:Uncharacterized protein n=1 Tax=Rhizobium herbae TaxID=508661 RepID=A0ABS4ENX5_9HYPH|nr:hypothetical protein [Rhizobium herbae]
MGKRDQTAASMDLKGMMAMGTILTLWMDVILLLTLQRDVGRRTFLDGSAERFSREDGASPCIVRSGRSADW